MDKRLLLIAASIPIIMLLIHNKKKRCRKVWAERWLIRRQESRGILHLLEDELRVEDPDAYKQFMRMCGEHFDELLNLVKGDISRQDTNMRECISPEQRLAVTLQYLATGQSYRSLMLATRIHESTISQIVPETCRAIYNNFKTKYMKMPSSANEWKQVENGFKQIWNFPLCIGAIDGKHINFRAPRSCGSYYFNYKKDHSIVLLAVVDANYKFLYVDVGVNGRISDGGVFRESSLKEAMDKDVLNFPEDCILPNTTQALPYTFVADDAFPLSKRIMKPYSARGLSNDRRIFNYRLSRARRVVENAFGILANRFRILMTCINLSPEKVEMVTLACCALHNFLASKNPRYTEVGDNAMKINGLTQSQGGNRTSKEALSTRDAFKDYFLNHGAVEWQNKCLNL